MTYVVDVKYVYMFSILV